MSRLVFAFDFGDAIEKLNIKTSKDIARYAEAALLAAFSTGLINTLAATKRRFTTPIVMPVSELQRNFKELVDKCENTRPVLF